MPSLVMTRIAAAFLTALGSIILFIPAAPAQAQVALVTCGGSQTTTYSPGLTNTAQTVQRAGQTLHTPCVSTAAPFTFSGSTSFTSTSVLSCLSLTSANTGTDLITWSTGRTSTFSYNRTVTVVQGQTVVTLTGSITAGDFLGSTAEETITSVSLDLTACSSAQGITSTYGVSELVILG